MIHLDPIMEVLEYKVIDYDGNELDAPNEVKALMLAGMFDTVAKNAVRDERKRVKALVKVI